MGRPTEWWNGPYGLLSVASVVLSAGGLVLGLLGGQTAARAADQTIGCMGGQPPPAGSVGCVPAAGTPHFPDSTPTTEQVRQLVQCGSTMYAVGTFNTVVGYDAQSQQTVTFDRDNAFSFQATPPFAVTSWNPDVNGEVNSIAVGGANCTTAYLGGSFSRVGGTAASNIVGVNASTGAVRTSFAHEANGQVETLLLAGGRLLAGGFFTAINGSGRRYYVGLDQATGRDDGYLRLRISGHYEYKGVSGNHTKVFNQQLSHGGTRVLAEGDFTSVGGKHRQQIFMLSLGASQARVTAWTSPDFYADCWLTEPFYIRAASWSPDDKTVYIGTTGDRPANTTSVGPRTGLCDAAAAFPATLRQVAHRWRNYTGCDSMYATVAGSATVYFGGHERWADNRHGCNDPGPGSIPAPGMVGLSTAGAVTFDPTRSRGKGADDMLLTGAGLWIASDNLDDSDACAGAPGLAGICFLPYPSGG